jgi:hypothetical protein
MSALGERYARCLNEALEALTQSRWEDGRDLLRDADSLLSEARAAGVWLTREEVPGAQALHRKCVSMIESRQEHLRDVLRRAGQSRSALAAYARRSGR